MLPAACAYCSRLCWRHSNTFSSSGVSPKAGAAVVQETGQELKLVYPQKETEAQPERFEHLDFEHFFLQPLHDDRLVSNTRATIEYCLEHPLRKLSLQTHKLIGIA